MKLIAEDGIEIDVEDRPGEIHVNGKTLFLEYWGKPDVTTQSFRDGWFATGDIAVLENGFYRIMGRKSMDIINSGGYKISALEIETVLLDHADVSECAVVGLPDDQWGEIIAVAFVSNGPNAADSSQLVSWCRERLSNYKLPRKFKNVVSLPRNAMGKVKRARLSRCLNR